MKEFLSQHGIPYRLRDTDSDPLTRDELWAIMTRRDGSLHVPILIDGDRAVLGWDPIKLERFFGAPGAATASAARSDERPGSGGKGGPDSDATRIEGEGR